jgi:hypothetical protein
MTLTESDRYLVATLAVSRLNSHELHKTTSKSLGYLHPLVKDIESIATECVVARKLGVQFDTSTYPRRTGCDLISPKGSKIEVKSSTNKDVPLRIKHYKKNEDVDIFVLVTGVFPHYEIKGYAYPEQVFQDCYLRKAPDGNMLYELPQSELTEF